MKNPRRAGRSGFWNRKMRAEDPRSVSCRCGGLRPLLLNLAAALANKRQTECAEHRTARLRDDLEHADRAVRSRSLEAHHEQVFSGRIAQGVQEQDRLGRDESTAGIGRVGDRVEIVGDRHVVEIGDVELEDAVLPLRAEEQVIASGDGAEGERLRFRALVVNPLFPALRSDPMALSGASRRKQIPWRQPKP